MNVLIKKSALKSIESISDYVIFEIQMPETAIKYTNRLIEFGYDLGKHFDAYTVCKNKELAKRGLRCATFDKKWMFAYKVGAKNIIIHKIIWAGRLK
jgi:hypothetical protein